MVVFAQGGGTIVLFAVNLYFGLEKFPVVLICESLHGGLTRLVGGLVLVLKELVLEQTAQIHLLDEENSFSTSKIITSKLEHSSCRLLSCVENIVTCELGVSDQGASK